MGKQGKNIMKRLLLFVLLVAGFEKQLQPVSKIEIALTAVGTGIATTYAAWKVQKMNHEGVQLSDIQKRRIEKIEKLLAVMLGVSVSTSIYNFLVLQAVRRNYIKSFSALTELLEGLSKTGAKVERLR